VRALLDLVRQNKAAMQDQFLRFECMMQIAISDLKILHPERGEEELIKSLAAEVANLREMAGKAELEQRPGGA
jgi:hypothetical protein